MARRAESGDGEAAVSPGSLSPGDAGLVGVRVAVLGCGALGSALARELSAAGAVPVLWSRDPARARVLLETLAGEAEAAGNPGVAMEDAELALVAVADDALEEFAVTLAADLAATPEAEPEAVREVVLHTNGLHGPGVLAPLAALGFATGKAHPLRAVPPGGAQELSLIHI